MSVPLLNLEDSRQVGFLRVQGLTVQEKQKYGENRRVTHFGEMRQSEIWIYPVHHAMLSYEKASLQQHTPHR